MKNISRSDLSGRGPKFKVTHLTFLLACCALHIKLIPTIGTSHSLLLKSFAYSSSMEPQLTFLSPGKVGSPVIQCIHTAMQSPYEYLHENIA